MINVIKNVMISSLIIASSLYAITAQAETPDGQTPAVETVCDPLKADGVTKGLYGLCVAFCEAQDFAEVSTPITEEELDALYDATPSGRLLTNYTKRATLTDPTMPCVVVEPPCPCFTAAELSTIDGVSRDGIDLTHRADAFPWFTGISDNYSDRSGRITHYAYTSTSKNRYTCSYGDVDTITSPSVEIDRGMKITEDEYNGCTDLLNQRMADHGH